MSTSLLDQGATSACGTARRTHRFPSMVLVLGTMATSGTASNIRPLAKEGERQILQCFTGGLCPVSPSEAPQTTAEAVSELRRLTGLTWDQLAQVLDVSRRSLHFWASGQRLNAANEAHLRRTLSAISSADRGSAHANRDMLMEDHGGAPPLVLLKTQQYDEFLRCVGQGPGRARRNLQPLIQAARDARKPLPPEQLIDAHQEPIHSDLGRGRAANTKRNHRRGRS